MNSSLVSRNAITSLVLVSWLVLPTFGQEAKKISSSVAKSNKKIQTGSAKNSSTQRDFEEVREFIEKVNSISEPLPRGEFETREAYEAKQPSLSIEKPILLRLERSPKDYSYNIDNKLLSIHIPVAQIKPIKKQLNGLPIQSAFKIENKGEYIASNAYGAKVKVEKTYSTNYILYIPNYQLDDLATKKGNPVLASMPESRRASLENIFKDGEQITMTLVAEPENAKRISENFTVFFRIRPKELKNSAFECTLITKPTISNPKELAHFSRAIEVDLLEILVRDGALGPILFKKTIGQPSAASINKPEQSDTNETLTKKYPPYIRKIIAESEQTDTTGTK